MVPAISMADIFYTPGVGGCFLTCAMLADPEIKNRLIGTKSIYSQSKLV